MKLRKNTDAKKREKSCDLSRFLAFLLAKKDFHRPDLNWTSYHGWDGAARTRVMQESKSCALTNLATSQNTHLVYHLLFVLSRNFCYMDAFCVQAILHTNAFGTAK